MYTLKISRYIYFIKIKYLIFKNKVSTNAHPQEKLPKSNTIREALFDVSSYFTGCDDERPHLFLLGL
jgi:hypothetical protein